MNVPEYSWINFLGIVLEISSTGIILIINDAIHLLIRSYLQNQKVQILKMTKHKEI